MPTYTDDNVARFWLKSDNDTTAVVSYNVTSLTDNGTGDWTINIADDFATANYTVVATAQLASTTYSVANMRSMYIFGSSAMTTGTCRLVCLDDAATTHVVKDPTSWMAVGFGALA